MFVYKETLLVRIKKLGFCCKNYVFSEVDLENWSNLGREVFHDPLLVGLENLWIMGFFWVLAPFENM